MGYTHYFYTPEEFDQEGFEAFSKDCQKILDHVQNEIGITLADGLGERGTTPVCNADIIRFNGLEDGSHETLLIERKANEPRWGFQRDENNLTFHFCKTARKPYDIAVTAVLTALKYYFGDQVRITSDGYPEEWSDGVELFRTVAGIDQGEQLNPITENEE